MKQNSKQSQHSNSSLSQNLKALLDGELVDFKDNVRQYVSSFKDLPPTISMEDHRKVTFNRVSKISKSGYSQLPYPKEYGGKDEGIKYLNFVELLSHGDLSTVIKQGVNYGLFGMSVSRLGTKKHHTKYLNDIMNARLLGGFAMTEMTGGSNVQGLKTTAIYDKDNDSIVINTPDDSARKAYIGNAANHGQMMVVFAQLKMSKDSESEGVHAFLVPIRNKRNKPLKGITIEDHGKKIGLNGIDNGLISFKNVCIPRDSMLDRFATINSKGEYKSDISNKSERFFKMIGTLVTGRIVVSLSSLSVAKNALSHSIKLANEREVFGEKLLNMPATQTTIFPNLSEAYALHFLTRDLIANSQNEGSRDLETLAAAVKARTSDFAFNVVDDARKKAGGEGYVAKYKLGMMRNDVDIFRTFEGDNTVLRLLVAKNLLDDLKQSFKEKSATDRFMKGLNLQFNTLSARYNLDKFHTTSKHLLHPEFHKRIFNLREKALRLNLAKKIVRLKKKFGSTKTAFDLCQKEALELADAYTTKMMVKKFSETIRDEQNPETKAALTDLYNLFVVHNMAKQSGWLLENGFMSSRQTHALNRIERQINKKVSEKAVDFVDAFSIPEKMLPPLPPSNMTAINNNNPKPGLK